MFTPFSSQFWVGRPIPGCSVIGRVECLIQLLSLWLHTVHCPAAAGGRGQKNWGRAQQRTQNMPRGKSINQDIFIIYLHPSCAGQELSTVGDVVEVESLLFVHKWWGVYLVKYLDISNSCTKCISRTALQCWELLSELLIIDTCREYKFSLTSISFSLEHQEILYKVDRNNKTLDSTMRKEEPHFTIVHINNSVCAAVSQNTYYQSCTGRAATAQTLHTADLEQLLRRFERQLGTRRQTHAKLGSYWGKIPKENIIVTLFAAVYSDSV